MRKFGYKKLLLSAVPMVIISLIAISCAAQVQETTTQTPQAEVIEWRCQAFEAPAMLAPTITQPMFVDRVNKMSDGRLKIKLYTAGELIPTFELLPALKNKTVEMSFTASAYYVGAVPEAILSACTIPQYIFEDYEHVTNLWMYEGLEEIVRKGYAKQGVYYLNTTLIGPCAYWSTKPINGLNDLPGIKFVQGSVQGQKILAMFGASSISIPHEERYTGLATGVVDAMTSDIVQYEPMKYYEVCPYFIKRPYPVDVTGLDILVSQQAWDALPNDLKEIVKAAGLLYSQDYYMQALQARMDFFNRAEQLGVEFIEWPEEDIVKLREASLATMFEDIERNELVDEGIKIMEDYLKLMEKYEAGR